MNFSAREYLIFLETLVVEDALRLKHLLGSAAPADAAGCEAFPGTRGRHGCATSRMPWAMRA